MAGNPDFQLQFEVASVRPVAPGDAQINIGMHIDGAQVRFNFLSVRDCMRLAYEMKNYQLIGPDWFATDHFNISAKLPAGSGQEQVREMLQNLPIDRFRMTIHREKRDFAVYALTLGKSGLKLQESAPDTGIADTPKAALDVKATANVTGVYVDLGNGAYFTFTDNHLIGHKMPMWRIADLLNTFMDKPVVDMTGLNTATSYDMSLAVTPEDYRVLQMRSAMKSGMILPPEAASLADLPAESFTSAIEGAGLRLEARKAPLDVIAIDHADRTPTEN